MELIERIKQTCEKLLSEGKLLNEEKLKEAYSIFFNRFNPDKLKTMDGELLAETLFNHGNKDSLVYWLEFKSDDEFRANRFGSIAGGSAFKFVMYKRREDGKWISGSPTKPVVLTDMEAVEMARKLRGSLLRGADLIAALQTGADITNILNYRLPWIIPWIAT